MTNKELKKLDFFLPDFFKGLSKSYILQCIQDEKIQENWYPSIGDVIMGRTGNIFVISGKHDSHNDLGGTKFFFGGGLCNRDGGNIMDETYCYSMNESGKWYEYTSEGIKEKPNLYHSSFSDFKYIPYPHEIEGELVHGYNQK